MGWFFVAALGAGIFAAWGLTAGWQINWGGVLTFYPLFLLVLATLFLARPRGQKDVWQIAARVCWPLALAALAEVFLKLEQTFGFLGFALSLTAQIAVWVAIIVPAIVSIYETFRLWQGGGADVSALSSVSEFVFRFLDWWQNLPAETLELGPGDRVMLVREQSLWDSVYPALLERGAITFLVGTVVGFVLAAVAFLYQGVQQLLAEEILQGLRFQWWLIPIVPFVFEVIVLTWTYFIAEWERRHVRYVFALGLSAVVRASFNLAGATSYKSDGPTTEIAELKRSSPGESPGSENRTFWGRQWDALLLRFERVQDVHVPSRFLGAADWLHAVDHAAGFCLALSDVVGQAKKAKALKEVVMRAVNEAHLEDALRSTGWSASTGDKADQIQEAYIRMTGGEGRTVDLWTVADPGFYDPITGQASQKAAGAARSVAVLATFPEAEAPNGTVKRASRV